MGFFSKGIKTIDDLFVHTLRDVYYAENQILKALPDMVEKASDPRLREAFEQHLAETENQVSRLEKVFEMHGVAPKGINCPAIDGILEEADEVSGETADNEVLDAALIASAQAVEHYEITEAGPRRAGDRDGTDFKAARDGDGRLVGHRLRTRLDLRPAGLRSGDRGRSPWNL